MYAEVDTLFGTLPYIYIYTTRGKKFMSRCNRAWDGKFARSMQPELQLQTGIQQKSLLANVGFRVRKAMLFPFFSGRCARQRTIAVIARALSVQMVGIRSRRPQARR